MLAVWDCETDPFKEGRIPKPFACELYWRDENDAECYEQFWGQRCIENFVRFLETFEEPFTIYAHNGGKFDFFFILPYLNDAMRIVNGRILEARIGIHKLRDSYAAVPAPLGDYQKTSIDYALFEADCRDRHRDSILSYLHDDCRFTYELIHAFLLEFGDVLTIGSASMRELKKLHKYERANEHFDSFYRDYYFGGRVQCFDSGVLHGNFKVYDTNSMYPYCMANFNHPISIGCDTSRALLPNTVFVKWRGKNYGAVPTRTKTGLDFTVEEGVFYSTRHEFEMGLETATIDPQSILACHNFTQLTKFDTFVETFFSKRMQADANGDMLHKLFYKLVLNSAYGKFAQNGSEFKDWIITTSDELPRYDETNPWFPYLECEEYTIWQRPAERQSFYNVATAASITGAARSVLLEGISKAGRPLYCDTDSIICEGFNGNIHQKNLGAWKIDSNKNGDLCIGNKLAIAGKKIYALFNDDKCIKIACKGAKLEAYQIEAVARGESVEYISPVPAFKLDGQHEFVKRMIRRTV